MAKVMLLRAEVPAEIWGSDDLPFVMDKQRLKGDWVQCPYSELIEKACWPTTYGSREASHCQLILRLLSFLSSMALGHFWKRWGEAETTSPKLPLVRPGEVLDTWSLRYFITSENLMYTSWSLKRGGSSCFAPYSWLVLSAPCIFFTAPAKPIVHIIILNMVWKLRTVVVTAIDNCLADGLGITFWVNTGLWYFVIKWLMM